VDILEVSPLAFFGQELIDFLCIEFQPFFFVGQRAGIFHVLLIHGKLDFEIGGDIPAHLLAILASDKMQKNTMPDFVGEQKEALIGIEPGIELAVDEDIAPVGGGGIEAVIADRDDIHAHDQGADKGLLQQKLTTVGLGQSKNLLLAILLKLVG